MLAWNINCNTNRVHDMISRTHFPPSPALGCPCVDVLAEAVGEVEEAGELHEDEGRVASQARADPALVQLILKMNDTCHLTW